LNVLTFWQSVFKGAILVAAVILSEKILATARRVQPRAGPAMMSRGGVEGGTA
jgi:hypothetical protein